MIWQLRRGALCLAALAAMAAGAHAAPYARDPAPPSPRGAFGRAADMEPDVLAEINFARTHPRDYAQRLRAAPPGDASPGDALPSEATLEAIAYLENRAPAAPLRFAPELGASAAIHAADQGEHGTFEHVGSDGSSAGERMRDEGVYAGLMAEAMSAGEEDAADVVRQLIVDEGVPGRGHRKDLLDPLLTRAGVGCAPHPTYGVICVIDLASPAPPRD